jgi:dipeptidyl aminopeptidase/acylaminoacyl peptidase
VHRPFSYLHPAPLFPRTIEIWDSAGKRLLTLADQSLADNIPIGGVRTGPRAYHWHPGSPSTLVWAEALDGGDPHRSVPHRDRLLTLDAPFRGAPVELHKTEHRLAGLNWFERDPLVLITDNDRNRRWTRTVIVARDGSAPVREVWSRSAQDLYSDPGSPVMKTLPNGGSIIAQNGDFIFLAGAGASPQGDLPFFDRFNIRTLRSDRLFRSRPNTYESLVAMLSADGSRFLTRHETSIDPPNYYIRSAGSDSFQPLTKFTDPTPAVRKIKKQLVTYTREDGVQLSLTLYLPPDYKQGTRLPTPVWAYPTEYNDAGTAGQVGGSTSRFTTLAGPNELFFLLQGYAILHNASMPVVGARQVVNDTYVKQITLNAKAAIDKAVELEVTDPNRVGVGGHSYGAFMTANLLAHTDLFKAGIARSGAYNRTLTPFGFQNEDRTLWEAEETYLGMSPFMFADKLKEPILFIHGEMDNNTGTFPIQSERMYQAVSGNGGITRLVMLPNESHGYAARESIEHTLYEMLTWFERWVKDVPPRR